ncbi:unnamed protein product [Phytophthora fragariaefolia]|uniref:Unnamed protein product n=1 Tax=Phytophthora fragariaefolia TaxID=1490495 RepID=A0A9W6Y4C1_9STRA|nr:unnamed protein product [Phytophthora fragariaefolia]
MTQEVAQRVAESWLTRKFTFRAGAAGKGGSMELVDVVGHLGGKVSLSDAVMHCALHAEVREDECAPHENEPGNAKARTILPAVISTEAGNVFAPSVTEIVVLYPKQPDAVSCGVLCLA